MLQEKYKKGNIRQNVETLTSPVECQTEMKVNDPRGFF